MKIKQEQPYKHMQPAIKSLRLLMAVDAGRYKFYL